MAKTISQRQAVLKLLLKGKPVSKVMAAIKTGCTTLTQRIPEFEKMGYRFKREYPKRTTVYKTSSYHAVYTLDLKHAKKKGLIK